MTIVSIAFRPDKHREVVSPGLGKGGGGNLLAMPLLGETLPA